MGLPWIPSCFTGPVLPFDPLFAMAREVHCQSVMEPRQKIETPERERMEKEEIALVAMVSKLTGGAGMVAVRLAIDSLVTAALAAGVAAERARHEQCK